MQVSSNLLNVKISKRIVITMFFLLLACSGVFGQAKENTTVINNDTTIEVLNSNEVIAANHADIQFMNWFMGSKSQNFNSNDLIDSTRNTKKQIIISGGTPNRVLYKTFVKKVVSIENATV